MRSSSVGQPNKTAEEKKRAAEKIQWDAHQQAFANYYGKKNALDTFSWELVRGEDDPEIAKLRAEQAGKGSGSIGTLLGVGRPLKDGLYRGVDARYQDWHNVSGGSKSFLNFLDRLRAGIKHSGMPYQNFFINIQNGVATCKPALRESEFASHQKLYMQKFNAAYGQIMDFMAVNRGLDTIQIDLPDINLASISQYDYMRLNAMLELAKERGLKVQFGPKIQEMLENRPSDFAVYQQKLQAVNEASYSVRSSDLSTDLGRDRQLATQKVEYHRAADALREARKDQGEERGEVAAKLTEAMNEASKDKTGYEKLAVLEAEVAKTERRLEDLNKAYTALESDIKAYEDRVEGATSEEDLTVVKRYVDDLEKERARVVSEMQQERDYLNARLDAFNDLDTRLREINPNEVPAKSRQPTAEQQEANQARKAALPERVAALREGVAKFQDNRAINLNGERVPQLKTKLEEKEEALQNAKAAPGG